MPIFEDVSTGLKEAMKARDEVRTATLRMIRAAFLLETKKDGSTTLADEACLAALRRIEKQRQESIEAFESAGRADRAAAERAELAVVQGFLPRLADEDATRAFVQAAIAVTGANSARDLGKVMGALMKDHKGEVDGTLARRIAAELLGG